MRARIHIRVCTHGTYVADENSCATHAFRIPFSLTFPSCARGSLAKRGTASSVYLRLGLSPGAPFVPDLRTLLAEDRTRRIVIKKTFVAQNSNNTNVFLRTHWHDPCQCVDSAREINYYVTAYCLPHKENCFC